MAITEKDNCGCGFVAKINGKASHRLIEQSLVALQRHTHRGAVDEDGLSADGCGLLLQMPRTFFKEYALENKLTLAPMFAVGMCFLNPSAVQANKDVVNKELEALGFSVVAWRDLSINRSVCGMHAEKSRPHIAQVIVNIGEKSNIEAVESKLMLARHRATMALIHDSAFYVCSLSTQVIIYKALVLPQYLPVFYPDLLDPLFKASFCIFHQRFSTNTLPAWRLAQPFRFLAHNGEINTIQGNRHAAIARSKLLNSRLYPELDNMRPIVSFDGSDSASMDNMLEFLVRAGMNFFQAIRLLIPPAWQNLKDLPDDHKAFYSYFSTLIEPWDGPASILFTDGKKVCCALDRNGFRPARYLQTSDGLVIVSSEAGAVDVPLAKIISKGKIGPGELIAVDMEKHTVLKTAEIDQQLSESKPYARWLQQNAKSILPEHHLTFDVQRFHSDQLKFYKKLYDISYEEINEVIKVMAQTAKEATFSMGDDTPIAALSTSNRPLFDYFRQQFAQVTNPPMDSLRESSFMSLETILGKRGNVFHCDEQHARRLVLASPVLSSADFSSIKSLSSNSIVTLSLRYTTEQTLLQAIDNLCDQTVSVVRKGHELIVLSDWSDEDNEIPVHPLLAVGAIHHRLIDEGLRYDCDLIIETGWVRDPHHFAALIAYGAAAIHPYLAHALIDEINVENGLANYQKAIENGLLKICSKMGISTINSYRGSQLFEIIGLSDEVVNRCFSQSSAKLAVLDFNDLDGLARAHFDNAHNPYSEPRHGGLLKYVPNGEYHDFNPDAVMTLLEAAKRGDQQFYRQFSSLIQQRPISAIRDLLVFNSPKIPLSLDEVEPVEAIFPRFETAAMSLGALSPEAHEALAVAMNTIGGRSNSGEGGEASYRHNTLMTSKIKQVASGRFGVTVEYLMHAEVIQIKMAQGAKPGEGGQLPGNKVNAMIAGLRYCAEGVTLISPPPHHDIYSIEDLAQLIFDLKQVNPQALVSVKLVAGPGIGTIAAGVVKAYADIITISGYDGGTGASPVSSIKYTGAPWELGLRETQQVLLENNLRHRVVLQVDGGFKTGFDVVKAAMCGAESFGFGTAPMVALGCKFLRICHLNNCATGLATQDDYLRQNHYQGSAERVINYFTWVAHEVREILASLGFRRLSDVIGRMDLLQKIESSDPVIKKIDLSSLFETPKSFNERDWLATPKRNPPRDEARLAATIQQSIEPLLLQDQPIDLHFSIQNCDRSIGAMLSGFVAKRYGMKGLAKDRINLHFTGAAGQSFGAWNCQGINLRLTGEANDYVGKGMNGGKIVIVPPADSLYASQESIIAGNTCLYGATGGVCYLSGIAGERFAVRNSGALAVVEGAGAHCCEYMTNGVVTVLGEAGMNFAAGMTGGVAFVLDINGTFENRYNSELVSIHRLNEINAQPFINYLAQILQGYVEGTGSKWGRQVVDTFNDCQHLFWLVKPQIINWDNLLDYERK